MRLCVCLAHSRATPRRPLGAFSAEEAALKAHLVRFRSRLQRNDRARSSRGFSVVASTLRRLGDREVGYPQSPFPEAEET